MKPALLMTLMLLPLPAWSAFQVPGFELVCSIPAETTLSPGDLRTAAEVWPEMFASAKKSIDISEFYIVNAPGEPLEPSIEALRKAGERGVKIRFIAERKMAENSLEGFELLRKIPNLELRVQDFSAISKGGITHAKYFIVDGREGYLGSQNFDWRSLKHIHELGLRVSEPRILGQMSAVFAQDWKAYERVAAGKPVAPLQRSRPKAQTDRRAYLVASPWPFDPPGVGDSERELVRLIGAAEKEVAVQLLDYAPLDGKKRFYAPIDNALRLAATRGVSVKLLVSNWNTDYPAVEHLKSLSLVPGVQVKIVTLPEAAGGYIPYARVVHAKYMVLDGKALWLGTSNWKGGYLDDSRNLEVVVKDEALAARARALHGQLWDCAYAQPIDTGKAYPKPRR
ncbi:MAG: phospholipase D-like domain-containing protein [Elusimicrobiota bacterium]|jgi:phosphatidylserine/phosphatidylglycerophosphate/cardiolipin synthase-like enzyme